MVFFSHKLIVFYTFNLTAMRRSLTLSVFIILTINNSFSQTFTSSNLPIIVINTNGQVIPDEPKITADMGIIFNAGNARNNMTDPFNHYNGKIGID